MKNLLLLGLVVFFTTKSFAQTFSTQTGIASFFAKTSMADIDARQDKVKATLNGTTQQISVEVPIIQFKFPKSLMESHFNTKHLESSTFPTATFVGKINETIKYTENGTYQVTATGKMKIHGVEKDKTLKGTLQVKGNIIVIDAEVVILLSDYAIKEPKIMFSKLVEQIPVKVHLECEKVK
jgi:polyisoprenoid-binding protein YceI